MTVNRWTGILTLSTVQWTPQLLLLLWEGLFIKTAGSNSVLRTSWIHLLKCKSETYQSKGSPKKEVQRHITLKKYTASIMVSLMTLSWHPKIIINKAKCLASKSSWLLNTTSQATIRLKSSSPGVSNCFPRIARFNIQILSWTLLLNAWSRVFCFLLIKLSLTRKGNKT